MGWQGIHTFQRANMPEHSLTPEQKQVHVWPLVFPDNSIWWFLYDNNGLRKGLAAHAFWSETFPL